VLPDACPGASARRRIIGGHPAASARAMRSFQRIVSAYQRLCSGLSAAGRWLVGAVAVGRGAAGGRVDRLARTVRGLNLAER
jgi:hypothetical protein